AALLGCALADAGRKVGLIDRDPQRTATRWIEQTKPAALELVTDINARESVQQADKVILITSPSPADLWTSQDTVQVIRQHYQKQKAAILFNQVQKQT